jgi:hypothetical protein
MGHHRKIPTTDPGVYLFRAPAVLELEINRHLVVAFHVVSRQTCGLVVCPQGIGRRDLVTMLDTVWGKLNENGESGNLPAETAVKIFGCPTAHSAALTTAVTWLRQHGLPIGAQDTGRSASRLLTIDCATGRVGVRYAESANPLVFLSSGSARRRIAASATPSEMLILCENPARRNLATQAIEEHRDWTVEAPEDIAKALKKTPFKKVLWSAVLITEGTASDSKLQPWLTRLQEEQSRVRKLWSGTLPSFAGPSCRLRELPKLGAETIDLFKQELAAALREEPDVPATTNVIPFPRRRTR